MSRVTVKNRIDLTTVCIALAMVIVIIASILLWLMTRSDKPSIDMRLIRQEGQVTLTDAGNRRLDILDDMRLYDGSVIMTDGDGRIMLSMDYNKVASLAVNSRLAFHKISDTALSLELTRGRLFFNVPRELAEGESFEISTGNMTVDIRGASGVVDADSGTVYCTDGVVTVTGRNPDTDGVRTVTLYPGQRAKIYLVSDRVDEDSVAFACDTITPEELPADVLEEIAPVEQLLDRVVAATGWDRGALLSLAGISPEDVSVSEEIYTEETETTTIPAPTPRPTPDPDPEQTPAPQAEALDAGSEETSGETAAAKPVITKPGVTVTAKPVSTASPQPAATSAPARPVRPVTTAPAEPKTETPESPAPEALDTTGPALILGETVAEDAPEANGYYKSKFITAKAADDMSGIADIVMDENSYEEPGFEVTENGAYTVTAADKAGNETVEEYEVTGIDSTGPEIEETDRELIGAGDEIEGVRVSLTVSDEEAGVTEDAEVKITGPGEQEYQPEESVFDEDAGSLTVSFTTHENGEYSVSASDALENATTVTVTVEEITVPAADPAPAPAAEEVPAP